MDSKIQILSHRKENDEECGSLFISHLFGFSYNTKTSYSTVHAFLISETVIVHLPLQTLLYNRQFIIHIILTCIMQTYSHNTNTQLCPSAVCFNELHSFCNRAVKPLWKRSLRWLFIAMQRLSMP